MGVLAEIFDINFRCFISIFTFTTLKHTYRLKKKTKTLMSIVCDKNIPCQKQAFLMSFLPIFHEKTTALMPIFCEINVHFLKRRCSHAFTLKFFMKKLALSLSYFVEKRPLCQWQAALMPVFPDYYVKTLL